MRRRFPWLPFFILAALLVFSSCDGASESEIDCASGYTSDGTLTASTSDGVFQTPCILVERRATSGFVVGGLSYEDAGGLPVASMGVSTGISEVGTYSIGDGGNAGGGYELLADPPASTLGNEAVSGTVTLSEVTETRIRGTFSFVTGQGKSVSNGRFDVAFKASSSPQPSLASLLRRHTHLGLDQGESRAIALQRRFRARAEY